jgi:hypothetical protein
VQILLKVSYWWQNLFFLSFDSSDIRFDLRTRLVVLLHKPLIVFVEPNNLNSAVCSYGGWCVSKFNNTFGNDNVTFINNNKTFNDKVLFCNNILVNVFVLIFANNRTFGKYNPVMQLGTSFIIINLQGRRKLFFDWGAESEKRRPELECWNLQFGSTKWAKVYFIINYIISCKKLWVISSFFAVCHGQCGRLKLIKLKIDKGHIKVCMILKKEWLISDLLEQLVASLLASSTLLQYDKTCYHIVTRLMLQLVALDLSITGTSSANNR